MAVNFPNRGHRPNLLPVARTGHTLPAIAEGSQKTLNPTSVEPRSVAEFV